MKETQKKTFNQNNKCHIDIILKAEIHQMISHTKEYPYELQHIYETIYCETKDNGRK